MASSFGLEGLGRFVLEVISSHEDTRRLPRLALVLVEVNSAK